jgi:hypothetical protein
MELTEREQEKEQVRRPTAATRHHIFLSWRDTNRGRFTLRLTESQMKLYS